MPTPQAIPSIAQFAEKCRKSIGTNCILNRIGTPRENGVGGSLVRQMMDYCRRFPIKKSPWLGMTDLQLRQVEKELGRVVLNSGDSLFGGVIMVFRLDSEDELSELNDADLPSIDFRKPNDVLR